MILTTNKSFEEWGGVVGDEVMAAAMLDRLLHRCHVVNIQGTSYRMRECKAARAHTRRRRRSLRSRRLLPQRIKLTKVGHLNLTTTPPPRHNLPSRHILI